MDQVVVNNFDIGETRLEISEHTISYKTQNKPEVKNRMRGWGM